MTDFEAGFFITGICITLMGVSYLLSERSKQSLTSGGGHKYEKLQTTDALGGSLIRKGSLSDVEDSDFDSDDDDGKLILL